MIEFYYETKLDPDIIYPEDKHTPAEVIGICNSMDNELSATIARLK